ncbi:flavodoxin [Actinoplanes sp. GCM10030250]|uniref:flavodoxin n=1 Tax=Actinoplanes sp. GCM10030250 TaxID=3273376 RepID=UPI00360EDFCB
MRLADVQAIPSIGFSDLLVVGAPTHAFSLSRPRTRADAAQHGAVRPGATTVGLREYLACLPLLTGLPAAAFDTKVTKPALPGSAARKAYRRLHSLDCHLLLEAESFHVDGMTGPVTDGELQRARRWGASLATAALPKAVVQQGQTLLRVRETKAGQLSDIGNHRWTQSESSP